MGDPTSTVRWLIGFALLVLACFVAAAGLDVWQMRTELRVFTACRRAAAAIRACGARFRLDAELFLSSLPEKIGAHR